jgi:hypothetical protein
MGILRALSAKSEGGVFTAIVDGGRTTKVAMGSTMVVEVEACGLIVGYISLPCSQHRSVSLGAEEFFAEGEQQLSFVLAATPDLVRG